ncbi:MAG: Dabb family protein [Lachnospiraceae bacterium]|nr:Dabb family protein [Lachnospiraceae bacterium]
MVHHIILWKIKEDKTQEEKLIIKKNVKDGLEGLKGKVPGIEKIEVQIESLESSTADIMLDSVFSDAQALKNYATHPAHVEVADTYVRPFMEVRMCLDFEK